MNTNKETNKGELSGKRVLVTGGTRGMGEATVKLLRDAGAEVMITARSTPANMEAPEMFVAADLSTPDGVQKVVDAVLSRFGGLGRSLLPIITALGKWGDDNQEHLRQVIAKD